MCSFESKKILKQHQVIFCYLYCLKQKEKMWIFSHAYWRTTCEFCASYLWFLSNIFFRVWINILWFRKYQFFNFHDADSPSYSSQKITTENFFAVPIRNNFNMHKSCFMRTVLMLLHVQKESVYMRFHFGWNAIFSIWCLVNIL